MPQVKKRHNISKEISKDNTRSSYKPAIYYVDSGLSFDASSEV